MSVMWKELSDHLNYKKCEKLKCTGNSTGRDNEVKIGKRSPLHNDRREWNTGNNTGFYSSLYHLQMTQYNEEKGHNRGKYHGQAIVSSQNCSSNSSLSINEESSSMKIKIMSAFSLNPNTSISPKGAMAKYGETSQVLFESVDSEKRLANAPIPTNFKGVDDSMFSNKSSKNTIQVYNNLATSQRNSAENQKLPNCSPTWHEGDNPAQSSNRVLGMEETKKEFQQERNGLHDQVYNNYLEIFDYVLDRCNKKANEGYSQTANVRQKQAPVLLDRYLEAASNSMFAQEVKRTKQVQAFDESVARDTMTPRGILSSPTTNTGERLPRKIRLPFQPQQLHLRALQAWKMKNEVLRKSTSPFQGLFEKTHSSSAADVSSKVAQKKPLRKSANPKRKVLTKNILITPEPELFANLQEFNLKNDEEPVVRVPNYFLDLTVKCTKNDPFTLMNSARPHVKNASSRYSDCRVQTMQHTKVKGLHSQETSKIAHESKPFKRQADSFLMKLSQDSGINISQDEEPDGILALQASAPATSVIGAILQNDNPILPRSIETKPKDKHETTDFRQFYKRIGGACPSVKPTPDFSKLLPPSPRERAGDDSYTKKGLVLDNNDNQLPVTKNILYLREEIEREKEFFATSSSQHGSQTAQNILSAEECPRVIHGLVVDKLKCLSSGNYLASESSGKKIIATCTETSAGQSVTTVHEGRKHHCDVCGRVFSRRNTLTTHKRIHTGDKPFPCDLCGRTFRQLGNLSRHKLTHAAVKPYVCPKCNKSFSRTSNLNTHLRTHTNYKPFVCDFCGKGFHQNVDMKIHRYTHTGEKPHKCITCGRGFKQLTHLKYHLRTHSAERLYKCQHCGKGFNQKGNLQAHIYGHTGKRPYRCEFCGKGFTLTSTLNTHKRIHAPNKPFKCEFCEKAFYQKNALKTHYISSHPYTDGVCLL